MSATTLVKHLTQDNHRELIEAATHLSKRAIEEMLATLFPQPDVPPLIRRVRTRKARAKEIQNAPGGYSNPAILRVLAMLHAELEMITTARELHLRSLEVSGRNEPRRSAS